MTQPDEFETIMGLSDDDKRAFADRLESEIPTVTKEQAEGFWLAAQALREAVQ